MAEAIPINSLASSVLSIVAAAASAAEPRRATSLENAEYFILARGFEDEEGEGPGKR